MVYIVDKKRIEKDIKLITININTYYTYTTCWVVQCGINKQ